MADPANKWIGVMTARTRNVLISGIAAAAIALACTVASSEASAMSFGGHGFGGGMPMMNRSAPVMSHVGPAMPAFNHVGPALLALNHVGPTLPMANRVGPSLPAANHVVPVIHGPQTTAVPHTPAFNTRTDELNRPTAITDRRIETNHGAVQPNAGTVGTAASVKPGTVVKPNLANNDHAGDVSIVKPEVGPLKPDVPVVKPDQPVVVEDHWAHLPSTLGGLFRYRDLLEEGGDRELMIDLDDNTSVHLWCRNDGQTGIACHEWNTGRVWQFVENKDGKVQFIPPQKAKTPVKPSYISLYDPETGKTVTRTWNPDGTHTDKVEEGNTLDRH
jgi:hypothetical protein